MNYSYLIENWDELRASPDRIKGKRVIIASLPKSASRFVINVLVEYLGLADVSYMFDYNQNGSVLDYHILNSERSNSTIGRGHFLGIRQNTAIAALAGVPILVLMRDLLDSIVSFRENVVKHGVENNHWGCIDKSFHSISEEAQYEMIVDLTLPLFYQFYVTWYQYTEGFSSKVCYIKYERLIADKASTIACVIEYLGERPDMDRIESIVNSLEGVPDRINLNKGIVGRGREQIPVELQHRIVAFAKNYPEVDFTDFGI